MSDRLDLVLLVHLHLPAGGSAEDCEQAWVRCFEPMLGAIHHTPGVRVGLVLSGDLIPDLQERHPEGLEWLRALVARGQVELIGTALYAPVLSSVPEADAVGQFEAHAALVRKVLGARTSGAWLPHGIWDPALPRVLGAAEVGWVAVPDRHLEAVGLPRGEVSGVFRTEREGQVVAVLPVDSRVAEVAAEVPVKRILAHLRGRMTKGHGLVALALAGERFGLHPGSNPRRDQTWFATLLAALARTAGVSTVLPSEAVALGQPAGNVYLPTVAPPGSEVPWERHLVRYDAANRLHKRVLRVSRLVARLGRRVAEGGAEAPDPAVLLQARRYLFRAQASEPYWHAEHAGVYDPGVRALAWKDALRAEDTALRALGSATRVVVERVDVDGDGVDEVVLRSRDLTLVVDPARAGGIVELSDHRTWRNWADGFTRVREPYHDDLVALADGPAPAPELPEADTQGGVPVADADRAMIRHLAGLLGSDRHPRGGFVETFLTERDTIRSLRLGEAEDLGAALRARPWAVGAAERAGDDTLRALLTCDAAILDEGQPRAVRLTKRYTLRRDLLAFRHELTNRSGAPIRPRLALCLDLSLGGPLSAAFVDVQGERVPAESTRDCGRVESVRLVDGDRVVEVRLLQPAHLWLFPVQSVHRHLGAWTSAVQAVCLAWVVRSPLKDGETARFDCKVRVLGEGTPQPSP